MEEWLEQADPGGTWEYHAADEPGGLCTTADGEGNATAEWTAPDPRALVCSINASHGKVG